MVMSIGLNGFFCAFLTVPSLPTMTNAIIQEEKKFNPKFTNNTQIQAKASALYNMMFGIGTILAPVFGGCFYDLWGY